MKLTLSTKVNGRPIIKNLWLAIRWLYLFSLALWFVILSSDYIASNGQAISTNILRGVEVPLHWWDYPLEFIQFIAGEYFITISALLILITMNYFIYKAIKLKD